MDRPFPRGIARAELVDTFQDRTWEFAFLVLWFTASKEGRQFQNQGTPIHALEHPRSHVEGLGAKLLRPPDG